MRGIPSVLFFYPQNLLRVRTGAQRRAGELLEYFRIRRFSVDLLTLDGFVTRWAPEDLAGLAGLRSVEVVPMRYGPGDVVRNGWRVARRRLPDLAVGGLRRRAREMAGRRAYDFAVISYVLWSRLAQCFPDATRVIDLHDFVTMNSFQRAGRGAFRLGRMFEDEVRAIRAFDWALSISPEETAALAGFCPETRFADVPVSFPERFQDGSSAAHDLLYVGGADNPFNWQGLEWFLERVWPALPAATRLAVAGDVCGQVGERPRVTLLGRVESLEDAYRASRVVICPVFGGTGLKVKVVEALSFARPVVTTPAGMAGLGALEGAGCLAAADEAAFGEGVRALLQDAGLYAKTQAEAKAFFLRRFSREAVWGALDRVFLP